MTWTTMPDLDSIAHLEVVVDAGLPIRPSDREQAKRIVRHGFADAGLWPRACGNVGPRPGAPTRALQIGRQLLVDRLLFDEIRAAREHRAARHDSQRRQRLQELADLQTIATGIGVRQVTAVREPDYRRTTFRAHLEPEGAPFAGVTVRFDDADMARHRNTTAVIVAVATALRAALVEHKLDEEDAGRAGAR